MSQTHGRPDRFEKTFRWATGQKTRDVNKDLTPKDQDKDLTPKDQAKDLIPKDQDKDKDLKYVLKDKDEGKDHS